MTFIQKRPPDKRSFVFAFPHCGLFSLFTRHIVYAVDYFVHLSLPLSSDLKVRDNRSILGLLYLSISALYAHPYFLAQSVSLSTLGIGPTMGKAFVRQ
jgi:hypothetical protein